MLETTDIAPIEVTAPLPPLVVRAYRLLCSRPVEGADLVEEQIRLGQRYKNKLIEIERRRRAAINAARDAACDLAPFVAAKAAAVDEIARLKAGIKTAKKTARARLPLPVGERAPAIREAHARDQARVRADGAAQVTALTQALTDARAVYAVAKDALKAARAAVATHPDVIVAAQAASDAAHNEVLAARKASGVYWGTYLRIETAVQAATGKTPQPRPGMKPAPWHLRPHFLRARGDGLRIEGEVAVQIQAPKTLTVAQAFACTDTRLRIEPIPRTPTNGSTRNNVALGLGWTRIWIRVGSDERKPRWAVFPLRISRSLPLDGTIQWAVVQRRLLGTRWDWRLHLTVTQPAPAHVDTSSLPDVAVNFGWRLLNSGTDDPAPPGIRVAYALGSDGWTHELRIPIALSDKLDHARSILAIRRRVYDEFVPQAAALVAKLHAATTPPEWWTKETATIAQWKSPERLWRLVTRWRAQRFQGDAAVFEWRPEWTAYHRSITGLGPKLERPIPQTFAEWSHADRHLADWGRCEERRVLGHRDHLYADWAAKVAKHAGRVLVDGSDYREIIERTAAGDAGILAERATGRRFTAAPGRARTALERACNSRGRPWTRVEVARKTITCHVCGQPTPFDAATELDHRCACGAMWDQDRNFCANVLKTAPSRDASSAVAGESSKALADGKPANERRKSLIQIRREAGKARRKAERSRAVS